MGVLNLRAAFRHLNDSGYHVAISLSYPVKMLEAVVVGVRCMKFALTAIIRVYTLFSQEMLGGLTGHHQCDNNKLRPEHEDQRQNTVGKPRAF